MIDRRGTGLLLLITAGHLVSSPPMHLKYYKGGKLMDFGKAIELLKEGKKVARTGWNGKGLWLELQRPDAHSKMTLPYIYMNYPKGDKYHDGCRVPWLASQTDMLEEDWVEIN